jgi:hypothetical protein
MEPIRDDTIGAFNTYLEALKTGDEIYFTLLQFDSMSVDKVHVNEPVANIPKLTRETFVPRASTPLIDAAYETIKAVERSVSGNPATKVVICIQTDGQENASTQHSWAELNALIKEKTAAGWQFNFMGQASMPIIRPAGWVSLPARPCPMTAGIVRPRVKLLWQLPEIRSNMPSRRGLTRTTHLGKSA